MKIYTGRGDQGDTSLYSGERVGKDALRVEAFGTLDELNSVLGVARSFCRDPRILETLELLQNQLFSAGSDLATTSQGKWLPPRIQESDWRQLEEVIDGLTAELPGLKNFILPAGLAGSSLLQLARAVCRRAERLVVRLQRWEEEVNPELLTYLNRLSDLLFTMARYENVKGGEAEVIWRSGDR